MRLWSDEVAHLTVRDTGIGIPPTDLPRLLERYRRAGNVDDRQFSGMGLGLYICSAIVEQHRGALDATSPGVGGGSSFHVTFPLATMVMSQAQSAGEPAMSATYQISRYWSLIMILQFLPL